MYMKGMKRLLGIVKMNPQVQPSEWVHDEVSCSIHNKYLILMLNDNSKLTKYVIICI